MSTLPDVLKFLDLTHQLQQVRRVLLVKHEDRDENDLEHMYQLAMLSWYLIEHEKLSLDVNRVLRYALVHDVVEAYAGDTYFYGPDNNKLERERAAAERLRKEFPEFVDLHDTIAAYEKRDDAEGRFVYALDKIVPILNIYSDGGRTWKRNGITLKMLVEKKTDKVAVSPEVKIYFDELVARLQKEEADLFPKRGMGISE